MRITALQNYQLTLRQLEAQKEQSMMQIEANKQSALQNFEFEKALIAERAKYDTSGGTLNAAGYNEEDFNKATKEGRTELQKGGNWGDVWNRIKYQFPGAPNEAIDIGLGTSFRNAGAYESYRARTKGESDNLDLSNFTITSN